MPQYGPQALQLTPQARFRLSPKSRVLVRETADGTLRVLHVDPRGSEHEIRWEPAPRLPKPAPAPARVTPRPVVHRPAADHPWRREIHQWAQDQQHRPAAPVAAGHL